MEELNIGDEVYIYENFWESLKEGKIIKGVIIDAENYDYGYHGSGDWVMDYEVKGEDGITYYANHGHGYKRHCIATKEELISEINCYIDYNNRLMEERCKELNNENDFLRSIIEKLQDVKVYTKKKER